jgi:hypothetical protein
VRIELPDLERLGVQVLAKMQQETHEAWCERNGLDPEAVDVLVDGLADAARLASEPSDVKGLFRAAVEIGFETAREFPTAKRESHLKAI